MLKERPSQKQQKWNARSEKGNGFSKQGAKREMCLQQNKGDDSGNKDKDTCRRTSYSCYSSIPRLQKRRVRIADYCQGEKTLIPTYLYTYKSR